MSGVDGQGAWVGWAGPGRAEIIGGVMFHPGNPAGGGFSLGFLVASTRSRRHLASWNATERRGGGGSVLSQRGGEGLWWRYGVLTAGVLTSGWTILNLSSVIQGITL